MRKIVLRSLAFLLFFAMSSAAGAEQIRLGIADFVTRTGMMDAGQLWQITELFTKILSSSSEALEVMGSRSRQDLRAVTAEDAASAGKAAGCQYVLLGAVMKNDMSYSQTYGGLWGTTPKTATQVQTMALDTRIIDVKTGKVVFSASGTGEGVFSYDVKEQARSGYGREAQNEAMNRYNDMLKEAASSAASMAAERICAFLTGEHPKVSSIKPNREAATKRSKKKSDKAKDAVLGSVKIDRGTSSGVKAGAIYRIYLEGEEVFDMNGVSLGRERSTIALARVKEVGTYSSMAEVVVGVFKNIRDDDKAEQISHEEALSIIERDDFARNRFSEFLR